MTGLDQFPTLNQQLPFADRPTMKNTLNRRQLLAALGSAGLAGSVPSAFAQDA